MSDWKRVENPAPWDRKPAEPEASAKAPEPRQDEQPAAPAESWTQNAGENRPRPSRQKPAEDSPSPVKNDGEPRQTALTVPGEEPAGPADPVETVRAFQADEDPARPSPDTPAEEPPAGLPEALAVPGEEAAVRSGSRYTKRGRRKGRLWYAAPLGFLVLALAAVGVVSLILTGINAIQKAQDDTPLREELSSFLLPVMQYCPTPFSSINDEQQDALLLAAIWRITKAEQVRQHRENDENNIYPMDDVWRMMIPIEEVEASYRTLFGPEAAPNHHNIDEENQGFAFEYDPDNGCYHVPFTTVSANYVPVLDTLKRKKDTVTIRVAYVSNNDVAIDDNGNEIPPTADQATYAQLYTVVKAGDGWALTSIEQEE